MAKARLNLKNLVALIVDRDSFSRGLTAQMLRGFGLSTLFIAGNGEEAKELLGQHCPDIAFIEGALPDMPTSELIIWIRRHENKVLRFLPIIVLSGYTQLRLISAARDFGAHLVVRKPLSPQTLFDRMAWLAKFDRPFLEAPKYAGPDRRFHAAEPSDGIVRRETDKDQPQPAILQA